MATLGTEKRPVVLRTTDEDRAMELLGICEQHGWKALVAVEPDQDEDIADLEKLLRQARLSAAMSARPRKNAPCPCGSGRKYKSCCSRA